MTIKLESIEKLRGLPFHGTNGFGSCVTASKETISSVADEIEREHAQRVAELNGAICERDGRIGSYERRNTELNDALKAICNRFGVSAEWSAEDAAKKVLEALERDYMLLPKDADGVPIRVGDKVQQLNHAGEWTNALPVIAVDENGCFATVQALTCKARTYIWGNNCHHVKPRTLEDVLQDAMQYGHDDNTVGERAEAQIAKYADEIRAMFGEVDHD